MLVTARDTDGNSGGDASGQFFIRGTVPPNSLPQGWTNRDVGAVGAAGSSAFSAGRFTIRGSGADIWNNADEFQFAYRAIEGNGEITARVDSVQNLDRWVKAGVMIRESVRPGARHVSLFTTPTTEKGVAFQRRTTTGGASSHTSGPAITAPLWLRLTRVGDVFRSYYRKNTVDAWTLIREETVPGFATPALFGLAVSSHVDGRLAEAVFSSVTAADNLPTWTTTLVGTTQGSATFDHTRFSVDGAGADIWGTSDGFTALWSGFVPPEETFTARVLSLENTNVWAKAGVMIRESLEPGGRHVMVIVSPGKGVAMQWRAAARWPEHEHHTASRNRAGLGASDSKRQYLHRPDVERRCDLGDAGNGEPVDVTIRQHPCRDEPQLRRGGDRSLRRCESRAAVTRDAEPDRRGPPGRKPVVSRGCLAEWGPWLTPPSSPLGTCGLSMAS